jgi:hypothetical protein
MEGRRATPERTMLRPLLILSALDRRRLPPNTARPRHSALAALPRTSAGFRFPPRRHLVHRRAAARPRPRAARRAAARPRPRALSDAGRQVRHRQIPSLNQRDRPDRRASGALKLQGNTDERESVLLGRGEFAEIEVFDDVDAFLRQEMNVGE